MKPGIKQFIVVAVVVVGILGYMVGGAVEKRGAPDLAGEGDAKIAYWVAPMDPNFRRDEPGQSPMGMDLIPVYEDGPDDTGIKIPPSTINNIGIRTAEVSREDLAYIIETVGYVAYDETRVSHVHMRAEGWIDELYAKVAGDHVKKGDVLFRIYSPDMLVAQSEYLQALKSGNRNIIDLAEERLSLLGFQARQIASLKKTRVANRLVEIYAEQSGIIVNLQVREKMFVTPETPILTIADLSSVWVQAEFFEEQSMWLTHGLAVDVETDFQPDVRFTGRVDHIHPMIDPVTRTLRARLVFDNPGEILKPNMYVTVSIKADRKHEVLSIPLDAVIRTGQSKRVIRALEGGRFEPVEVEIGRVSGGRVEISKGLAEGDRIVVSGQFLIDSEASLSASLRRMSDPVTLNMSEPDLEGVGAIKSVGILNSVMADHRMVNITHEAIPEIGWPTMTMNFEVGDGVDLSSLQKGAAIHFELTQGDGETFVVTAVHVMNQ